ncbi:MAG: Do family serine endopeptidase [Robiginitomaculum sp.]
MALRGFRRNIGFALALGVSTIVFPAAIFPAAAQDSLHSVPTGFSELTKRLAPAVVNISTSQTIEIDKDLSFKKGSPLEKFNDFFGDGEQNRVARSLGSGFVIDKEGYIVTNNHVVEGADEIEVAFPNGESYDAKLIGRDPSTDIALLKIKAGKDIPFVSFAKDESVEVGEWVIAIGNPLGYSSSVAAGIVSARHRQMSMTNYDDFIQTDVAINKGNSGGPLFDMDGKVIGVNTAIVSPTGYSVGLSFSVPSGLAESVVKQLKEHGETRRGFLGVRVQKVTKDMAKAYKLKQPYGALISAVTDDSPAQKVGLKRGDLITHLGGVKLEDSSKLARLIAEAEIDADLKVDFIRKRKKKSLKVKIERLKEKVKKAVDKDKKDKFQGGGTANVFGITVEKVTEKLHTQYKLEDDVTGVLVTKVDKKSDAADKISKGDIIITVNQELVEGPEDFQEKMKAAAKSEEPIILLINRRGRPVFYTVNPVG